MGIQCKCIGGKGNLPKGATGLVEPINETKGFVSEIADTVGALKRSGMEKNTSSSAEMKVRFGKPIFSVI